MECKYIEYCPTVKRPGEYNPYKEVPGFEFGKSCRQSDHASRCLIYDDLEKGLLEIPAYRTAKAKALKR